MVNNINVSNLDATELFTGCLEQATVVVKQVTPNHYANATPDTESDVRDVASHMLAILQLVTRSLSGETAEVDEDALESSIDRAAFDLSVQWQTAIDELETLLNDVDMEAQMDFNGEKIQVENFLVQLAGDLLIHAWDLGEAIGMPVKFGNDVAEAVMETTIVPNNVALPFHNLFAEPISPPANADLQTRLLALFGRSYAWRTAN